MKWRKYHIILQQYKRILPRKVSLIGKAFPEEGSNKAIVFGTGWGVILVEARHLHESTQS
jgi:hypothetical protein